MRNYVDDEPQKRRSVFWQGFRLGVIFGVLGALTVLGQRASIAPNPEPPNQ